MGTAYADKLPYWQTSKSGPDHWVSKAAQEIERAGGEVSMSGFGRHDGKSVYFLQFQIEGERYRVVWPVLSVSFDSRLRSKHAKMVAARRQAATAMYHDVKAACLRVRFLGAKAALFAHLELPDGRVAAQLADGELADIPLAINTAARPAIALPPAEIVDAEEVLEVLDE